MGHRVRTVEFMTMTTPTLTAATPDAARRRDASLATLALVLVTAVWGSSFFLIRDLVDTVPPNDLSAIRFVIAAVAMLAIFGRRLVALTRRDVVTALLIGAVYGLAQLLQTYGLASTSASTSGFLTGLCVVLTPILALLLFGEQLPRVTWIAVALSAAGLAVLCFGGGEGFAGLGTGELLTLASAGAYALQMIALSRYVSPEKADGMAVVMMLGVALTCGVGGLADGGIILPATPGGWAAIVWMALFAGALAMWAQAWAQSRMPATRAAIVMTLEPVFASVFAVLWGGESVTRTLLLGGGLILLAMLVAEVLGSRAARSEPGTPAEPAPGMDPRAEIEMAVGAGVAAPEAAKAPAFQAC